MIRIYGLFDDPPTARLLLCKHHHYATATGRLTKPLLPAMPAYYREIMHDLNWLARRLAIQISYTAANGSCYFSFKLKSAAATVAKQTTKQQAKGASKAKTMEKTASDGSSATGATSAPVVDKMNLFAKLRYQGHVDILRQCIAWI
jgi:hypothetical protein